MIRTRFGYTLLLYVMLPKVLWRLLSRARKEAGYRRHVRERFGRYAPSAPRGCIWIHAVSVGETRAAQPIIERLLARDPERRVLLTHMTPTGRAAGAQLFGERVIQAYLPYDYPGAVARFLDHFRPTLGLLMETEIWFNLIHACKTRAIPLYLVNARLSEQSQRRYRRIARLTASGLNKLTAIAAQSTADAERFRALGALRVEVVGNVKFDITPPPDLVARGCSWRARWGLGRPVWLAASTRQGEEALLLAALDGLRVPGILTIIVPRHPQRFDEVATLLRERGLRFVRASMGEAPTAETEVLLGDTMGELFAWYASCDVAFVGGSLRPFGAHNLLEACVLGKPVVIGPSVFNFQEATELGLAAGAVVQVANAAGVIAQIGALLADAARREAMGAAGMAFAARHRGAVERLLALIGTPA